MKQRLISAGLVLIGAIAIGAPTIANAADKVTAIIPQNSVLVLNWEGAKDAGVFAKHGIDLTVDARPFAGYLASIPSKQAMATTYSGIDAIQKMTEGMDIAIIGGGLTVFQEIFVRVDSPIKTLADLKGKKIGVWSTGAGAYKTARAAIIDAAGIDITKDAKLVQVAAPALYKMAERGDVDAMLNISSFSMQAASEPSKFRSIFSPNEYWKKKTGFPLMFSAPLVAWKSWVKENPTRAKNYSDAVDDSFRWLRDPDNFDKAVQKYGAMAGVTSPEAKATYKKWLGEKKLFLADWSQKAADAQWAFLNMAKQHGVLNAVPDEATHALVFK